MPLATVQKIARRWGELLVSTDSDLSGGPTLIPSNLTFWQTVVAGTVSSVASRTTTAPLERLKVDLQAGRGSKSLLADAKLIYRTEGPVGFFRGNLLHCLRVFPSGIITCYAWNAFDSVESPRKSRRLWQALWTALAAGLAAVCHAASSQNHRISHEQRAL